MDAALLKPDHALQAQLLVPREPAINGVGLARFQEAMAGDGVGREAIGDLEQGGTAFADIRAGVMIAVLEQVGALGFGEVQGATIGGHESAFLEYPEMVPSDYPFWSAKLIGSTIQVVRNWYNHGYGFSYH